jgi:hypothetical protein
MCVGVGARYRGVLDPELGVVLLGLQLQLEVEQKDLGGGDLLGLLLEASVREALLECHALDEQWVLQVREEQWTQEVSSKPQH